MLGYLSADIICSSKLTVQYSLYSTDNLRGQIQAKWSRAIVDLLLAVWLFNYFNAIKVMIGKII